MKKKTMVIIASVLAVVIIAALLIVLIPKKQNNTAKAYAFKSVQEVYAFSVVSGVELALTENNAGSAKVSQTDFEKMVDSIHSYFPVFESFVGDKQLVVPTEEVSDNPTYAKMMNVDYVDMAGNTHVYKIYYNETVPSEQNRPWQDKDDDEINTNIEGQIVIGEETYTLTGKKEMEKDEVEITFEITLEGTQKIKIEQETENNEQEFTYSLYEGSVLQYTNSIGIEVENGMIEFETEYESAGIELELEIKQAVNATANTYYIEYEENNKEYKIIVEKKESEGAVQYVYTMGSFEVVKNVA